MLDVYINEIEIMEMLIEVEDQTGLTANEVLGDWTIEDLAEAMEQTGLSMEELLEV